MKWHSSKISFTMWSVRIEHQTSVCGSEAPSTTMAHQRFMHRPLAWPNRPWKRSTAAICSARKVLRGALCTWTSMRTIVIVVFLKQCCRVSQAPREWMHRWFRHCRFRHSHRTKNGWWICRRRTLCGACGENVASSVSVATAFWVGWRIKLDGKSVELSRCCEIICFYRNY